MLAAREPFYWNEFSQQAGDLATQLSYAVVFSPEGTIRRDSVGMCVDEWGRGLWMWSTAECDTVLDWLWEFFRVRLANRVWEALKVGGVAEAMALCDALACWFRLKHIVSSYDGRTRTTDIPVVPVETAPGKIEAEIELMVVLDQQGPLEFKDPLLSAQMRYSGLSEGYRETRRAKGLNGYESKAWDPFITVIDELKAKAYEDARHFSLSGMEGVAAPQALSPHASQLTSLHDASESVGAGDGLTKKKMACPVRPFSITGNAAPAHAEAFRAAVRHDPALRFGSFAALANAAGIAGMAPERTVGRAIKKATGWQYPARDVDAFVTALFVAVSEDVPTDDGS